MKNSIMVLTEAGYGKGFGHYFRMTSIRECAYNHGIPFQMIIDGDDAARKNLSTDDVRFMDWQSGQTDISEIIDNNDIVVIDSYHVSLDTLDSINDRCARMIVIDDNMRLDYRGMEVLNPNYYGEFMEYPEDKGNNYYLGKDYTLLREAFRSPENRTARENVEDILITMGGTDAKGETVECIRMIKSIDPDVRLHVVTTSAYKNPNSIKSEVTEKDCLYKDISPEEMSGLMSEVDFAVASAGGTSNELIKMQCPAILNVVADNQVRNSEIMSRRGCFRLLDKDKNSGISEMFSFAVRDKMIKDMRVFSSESSGARFIINTALQSFGSQVGV